MNTLKLSGLIAGPMAVAAILTGVAGAQTTTCPAGSQQFTQTVTDQFGPELANWPVETLTVPKFAPPPGATLIRVELSLCGRITGTATYTNTDTTECTFTFEISATVTADAQDPTAPLPPINFSGLAATGGPITLPGGASGGTGYDSGLDCIQGNPLIFRSGPTLDWFTAGPGDTTVDIDHSGVTTSTTNGCGALTFDTDPFTVLTLSVNYVYCVELTTTTTTLGCACSGPSPHYRRPGSLLLYPEFDNRTGDVTVLTVTNTACGINTPNVDVEFRYIDKDDCSEFNRTRTLTACDTISLLTNFHNPQMEQGYVYVWAKNANGDAIVWNHLIGNLLVVSGIEAFDYSVNPVAFRGIGSGTGIEQRDGTHTDLDGDNNRDLDGHEYEQAPDTITVPRFLGQDEPQGKGGPAQFKSQLILIALSGGAEFETTIDCLIYNDNEEAFSFDHTFYCWEKPYLRDLSFAFSNSFLKTTEHAPLEILGHPDRESGWICCDGAFASSTQETITDPAFYMVLVERVGPFALADLPFECGTQVNGSLLPRDLFGDGDPTPEDGDDQ
jgi:hypothetical protein